MVAGEILLVLGMLIFAVAIATEAYSPKAA